MPAARHSPLGFDVPGQEVHLINLRLALLGGVALEDRQLGEADHLTRNPV
jgi:hypothetical protein